MYRSFIVVVLLSFCCSFQMAEAMEYIGCEYENDAESGTFEGMSSISYIVVDGFDKSPQTSGVTDENYDVECRSALVQHGFENVSVQKIDGVICVAMEDPRFRGTFRGASKALRLLAAIDTTCTDFEILMKEWNVGRVVIHATRKGMHWDADVNYSQSEALKKMVREQGIHHSSYGKVDITFHPLFTLDNHRLDVLYQFAVRLAPSFEAVLWKGNRFVVQPIIPIYNNYREYTRKKRFQLGTVAVFQDLTNSPKWWLRAGVGQFRYDRLGVNVNAGFHINTFLDASVITNVTTESYNLGKKWYVGVSKDEIQFSALAKLCFYDPYSSLQVEVLGGRFLYGDYGGRVDVSRHIGEYTIGVYGMVTDNESNFGFHFAIPVGGKSQFRKGWVRPRLPQYYTMEYSQKSSPKYTSKRLGQMLTDMPDESRSSHYWQAKYIKRYLLKSLNNGFE